MSTKPKSSEKHFRCTICQRGFTRIDHLKRHHLRHSGLKPYSCVFCNEAFARCDNLRDHYSDCPQRGDQKIPETGQRGRRRHACQSCTSMKLRCDGQSPCSSCQKRGLECNNERKNQTKANEQLLNTLQAKREDYEQASDRGSIKFLLNAGTDSFTEQFHLPPRGDRARGLVFHNQSRLQDEPPPMLSYPVQGDTTEYPPTILESNTAALSFYQDTFINFFNGPFGDSHKLGEDPYTGGLSFHAQNAILSPGPDANLMVQGEQHGYEPEQPFASALVQSILARAWTVPLDTKAQEELSTNLNFLLTTARIRKFIILYFKYWHPSCAMVHPPTFDPNTVALPLLTSVVFMGAMYSTDEREAYVAKRVLDFAELLVFSSDAYSCENEIAVTFTNSRPVDEETSDWIQFQNFQAGFLMVPIQYWAGSRVARNRAMENRFSEVLKVARRMGLLKCRHLPQDRVDEYAWIQNESRLRTVNIISLMDCAFSFYQNYPCRLSYTEMECEFPCEESLFYSPHPFSEPNFRFSRGIIVADAFRSLFDNYSNNDRPGKRSQGYARSAMPLNAANPTLLTVLDMFILIHLLYAFINTHMTLLVPAMNKDRISTLQTTTKNGSHASTSDASSRPVDLREDLILASIRNALSRWRDIWVALRNQVPGDEWAAMGFYRNAHNFWLVSQLLITKKEGVDVIMRMEVKCEDKLEKLKVLLQDESD